MREYYVFPRLFVFYSAKKKENIYGGSGFSVSFVHIVLGLRLKRGSRNMLMFVFLLGSVGSRSALETMLWNEYDAESTEMSDPAEITATETRHNASTEVIGFLDPAESKDDSGSDLKHSHTDLLATVSSDTTEYDTDSIEMSDPADIIVTETSVDLQAVSRDTAESKNEHGTKIKGSTALG